MSSQIEGLVSKLNGWLSIEGLVSKVNGGLKDSLAKSSLLKDPLAMSSQMLAVH
jgi:hypothetical protein